MFIHLLESDPVHYISWVSMAVFSICAHEYAHASTAVRFGDNTPERHLTMNPLIQMGWMSLLMLVLFGIAWGSVPVDPRGTGSKGRDAMISFAGPLTNLLLCVLFSLLSVILARIGQSTPAGFFALGGCGNGALFLFNMVPIPPLDGFHVLKKLVPAVARFEMSARNMLGVAFLIFWFTPLSDLVFAGGKLIFMVITLLWSIPVQWISQLVG
jgi:Zn-dependent protease